MNHAIKNSSGGGAPLILVNDWTLDCCVLILVAIFVYIRHHRTSINPGPQH